MEKSKVYFTDMRCPVGTSLLHKLDKLIRKAGIEEIDFEKKFAAIKIHFGEPGNMAFLRHNFSKVVADRIKECGGIPFLTDCNTLYVGRRKDAIEHITSAYENGYTPFSTGCHVLIADGLKGTNDVEVPIEGGEYCKTARIGAAVMDADIFISLTHYKVHEETGVGGVLKNIGMGCGSRAGKMQMHHDGKPAVNPDKCKACGLCKNCCGQDAFEYDDSGKARIIEDKCVGCGRCIGICNFAAIANVSGTATEMLNYKIVEYTKAVIDKRPHFHICIVNQVSPRCDCHGGNDVALVPDIGMFASFDPVALDAACTEAVNNAPIMANSELAEVEHVHEDHITDVHPIVRWKALMEHGEKIGLGTTDYELITI